MGSRTRSSPPTRAVNETDFGAEKVASIPPDARLRWLSCRWRSNIPERAVLDHLLVSLRMATSARRAKSSALTAPFQSPFSRQGDPATRLALRRPAVVALRLGGEFQLVIVLRLAGVEGFGILSIVRLSLVTGLCLDQ